MWSEGGIGVACVLDIFANRRIATGALVRVYEDWTLPMRTFYLAVLASHVLLSTVVVPGALTAFWFAWRREFGRHRKVTRVLMPIWLYVSVTGVLIWWLVER